MADAEYDSDNSWAGNEIRPGKREEQDAPGSDADSIKQSVGDNDESDDASHGQEFPTGDQMEVDPESDSEEGNGVGTEDKSKSMMLELAQLRAKLAAQYHCCISEHCKSLNVRQTLEQATVKISSVLDMLERDAGDIGVAGGK